MQDNVLYNVNHEKGSQALAVLSAVALPTSLFGLYTFILMGAGVQGDIALTGGAVGGFPYYMREVLLLLGFVLYGALSQQKRLRALSSKAATGFCVLMAVLFACCALVMQVVQQGFLLVVGVLAMELLVGFAGGAVYEKVALFASSTSIPPHSASSAENGQLPHDGATRVLGLIVGIGGALAVVVQYLLQIQVSLGGWFVILLAACFCLLAKLFDVMSRECSEQRGSSAGKFESIVDRKQVLYLVIVVACLFMSFPFYEVVVSDTLTSADFYQWHRLFLAVGYIAIGAAAFLGGRPMASLAIAIAAPFTAFVLSQTISLQVGPFTMALYYALLGAIIAYSGIAFMSLAPHTRCPAIVASASRLLEGLITIAAGSIVALVGEWSAPAVLLVALGFIALTIAIMVRGGFFTPLAGAGSQDAVLRPPQSGILHDAGQDLGAESTVVAGEPMPDVDVLPVDASQLAAIAERYSLTRREAEVLGLVFRGFTAQQIADELVVTKSTVKFHVTNILKKTGAETRQQLVEKLSDGAGQTI